MITRATNHVSKGLGRLIEQWQDKRVVKAILNSILVQCQEVEDALNDIADSRLLGNLKCVGHALNLVGRLVGEEPRGRSDDVYTLWIRARVKVNNSYGRSDDLIGIVDTVESSDYTAQEYFPAAILFEFGTLVDAPASDLFEMLKEAKMHGVWLGMVYGNVTDSPFSCCAGTSVESTTATGFGLTDQSTGGEMSHVFSV